MGTVTPLYYLKSQKQPICYNKINKGDFEMEQIKNIKTYKGVNWNDLDDDFSRAFFEQNTTQYWLSQEIPVANDEAIWKQLPAEIQDAYEKNLIVLTFFDTHQGNIGMNAIINSVGEEANQVRAVLSMMSFMENVHAESYSTIFSTFSLNDRIKELFKWGEENIQLQTLMNLVIDNYKELDRATAIRNYGLKPYVVSDEDYKVLQWKAMVSSCFLESWLFYSGFYYPLYFYGQKRLMNAGEIINLIIRDESIHGVYVGTLARAIFDTWDNDKKEKMELWMRNMVEVIHETQMKLIDDIYGAVNTPGLVEDVKQFCKYNCNKALGILGFEEHFKEVSADSVNPVVINGLSTKTKTHDFFSQKGNGYQIMKTEFITEEDWNPENYVPKEYQKE